MATVNFNLRSQSKAKAQPISLIFRHQNLRVVYSTGLKVSGKHWSTDRQRVKNVTHVPERDRINNTLNQLQAEVKRWAVGQIEARQPVTADALKQHLDDFTGRRPGPRREFFPYFRAWIESAPGRILPKTGKPPTTGTIKQYRTTLAKFSEFAKAYRRTIDFGTIDLPFYDDFVSWLQGQGAAPNTVGKYI
ncbi:MAG: Arm DNA-binding domain-containing protein, partial [Lewinella sp.]